MKVKIALLACTLCLPLATNAVATQLDTSGLTDAQVADLQAKAFQTKATNLAKPAQLADFCAVAK